MSEFKWRHFDGEIIPVSYTHLFTPQASGSTTANLSFTSGGSNSPFTATLTGSGAAPVQHSVDLFWDASTSSVTGYNVYRGEQSGGPYSKINATPVAVSYTHLDVYKRQLVTWRWTAGELGSKV